jgi:hypothetical protein
VEGGLEAPKHLARAVHDLYFEPRYEEFRPRTIWSVSNAFTSAFKELDSPVQGSRNLRSTTMELASHRSNFSHRHLPVFSKEARLRPQLV